MITSGAGSIVRAKTFAGEVTAGVLESFTVIVTLPLKGAPGVPVIWLPATLRLEGRPVAVNVYGPVPPVAAKLAAYAAPTTPFGSDVVVTVSLGTMVIERLAVVVCGVGVVESATVTLAALVPAALGVPVIRPDPLIESPAGNPMPEKVYGKVPPEAPIVAL